MLENVQEVAERAVAHPRPFGDEQREMIGEHAQRTDQPHEVDDHAGGAILRQVHDVELARGERDHGTGGEVHDFRRRIAEAPDAPPLGAQPL